MGKAQLQSFIFDYQGTQYALDLTNEPTHKSNESSGVWVIDGQAWKIFSTMNQWNRIHNDYEKARCNSLPTPAFEVIPGTITRRPSGGLARGLTKHGFALRSTYINAPFFALDQGIGIGNFTQFINSITNVNILWQIELACQAAINIGLKDPQGLINHESASHPIMFIDLHTNRVASGSLRTWLEYVTALRTRLQQ